MYVYPHSIKYPEVKIMLKCIKCNIDWKPRLGVEPIRCPSCRTKLWKKKDEKKSRLDLSQHNAAYQVLPVLVYEMENPNKKITQKVICEALDKYQNWVSIRLSYLKECGLVNSSNRIDVDYLVDTYLQYVFDKEKKKKTYIPKEVKRGYQKDMEEFKKLIAETNKKHAPKKTNINYAPEEIKDYLRKDIMSFMLDYDFKNNNTIKILFDAYTENYINTVDFWKYYNKIKPIFLSFQYRLKGFGERDHKSPYFPDMIDN